jgi:hypothetical protein
MLTEEDKQWISGQLARMEIKLPTGFHKWASPADLRARSHAAVLGAIDTKMESLSNRAVPEGGLP